MYWVEIILLVLILILASLALILKFTYFDRTGPTGKTGDTGPDCVTPTTNAANIQSIPFTSFVAADRPTTNQRLNFPEAQRFQALTAEPNELGYAFTQRITWVQAADDLVIDVTDETNWGRFFILDPQFNKNISITASLSLGTQINGKSFIISGVYNKNNILINGGTNSVNPPENSVLNYRDQDLPFAEDMCPQFILYATLSTRNINDNGSSLGLPYLYFITV